MRSNPAGRRAFACLLLRAAPLAIMDRNSLVPMRPMKISRIGPIEVLAALGQGAKSNVMLVRREADANQYALKVVPVAKAREKKYLAQARQEFRVGQMLDHPNLVEVHAIETETDWLVRPKRVKLLIEYVPGQTLDRIAGATVEVLLPVFEQVADAVAYMHENGVVHADLKPNNIMLGPGIVKVIDYGLARIDGEEPGRLQGTPEYMAPETASRKVVNELTDIYNFGATMYRLLTGLHPPSSVGTLPLTERAYRERFRAPCEVNAAIPLAVGELMEACLSFKPAERPQTMGEVYSELSRIKSG